MGNEINRKITYINTYVNNNWLFYYGITILVESMRCGKRKSGFRFWKMLCLLIIQAYHFYKHNNGSNITLLYHHHELPSFHILCTSEHIASNSKCHNHIVNIRHTQKLLHTWIYTWTNIIFCQIWWWHFCPDDWVMEVILLIQKIQLMVENILFLSFFIIIISLPTTARNREYHQQPYPSSI